MTEREEGDRPVRQPLVSLALQQQLWVIWIRLRWVALVALAIVPWISGWTWWIVTLLLGLAVAGLDRWLGTAQVYNEVALKGRRHSASFVVFVLLWWGLPFFLYHWGKRELSKPVVRKTTARDRLANIGYALDKATLPGQDQKQAAQELIEAGAPAVNPIIHAIEAGRGSSHFDFKNKDIRKRHTAVRDGAELHLDLDPLARALVGIGDPAAHGVYAHVSKLLDAGQKSVVPWDWWVSLLTEIATRSEDEEVVAYPKGLAQRVRRTAR